MVRTTCKNCGEKLPPANKTFCSLVCQKSFSPGRLRRPCRECEEMFQPETKGGRVCKRCSKRNYENAIKKAAITLSKKRKNKNA